MPTVFEMLEREWKRLGHDSDAARRLRRVCRVAGGASTLHGVERYVRSAAPADADRVLLALVRAAVEGDTLASRTLLQLLLPGTRRLARTWWALGNSHERAAAAVAAVYCRIVTYPVERRPGRVAANILLDATRELRRAVGRTVATPTAELEQTGPAGGTPVLEANAADELAQVLLEAVHDGVIDPGDAELVARSRIAGQRVADIAQARNLSPRTLWDRRQRAEQRLAAAHRSRVAS